MISNAESAVFMRLKEAVNAVMVLERPVARLTDASELDEELDDEEVEDEEDLLELDKRLRRSPVMLLISDVTALQCSRESYRHSIEKSLIDSQGYISAWECRCRHPLHEADAELWPSS